MTFSAPECDRKLERGANAHEVVLSHPNGEMLTSISTYYLNPDFATIGETLTPHPNVIENRRGANVHEDVLSHPNGEMLTSISTYYLNPVFLTIGATLTPSRIRHLWPRHCGHVIASVKEHRFPPCVTHPSAALSFPPWVFHPNKRESALQMTKNRERSWLGMWVEDRD